MRYQIAVTDNKGNRTVRGKRFSSIYDAQDRAKEYIKKGAVSCDLIDAEDKQIKCTIELNFVTHWGGKRD